MDHPAHLATVRPWRAAALVAATIATLELVILLVLAFTVGGRLFSDRVRTVTEAAVTKATSASAEGRRKGAPRRAAATLPRSETSVVVLNGNGVAGAAAAATERVRKRGYVIAGTANAPRSDFSRSLVMYRPRFEAEARRLAHDLRVRRVVPLDGMRSADLQGAHVAFIIGE